MKSEEKPPNLFHYVITILL